MKLSKSVLFSAVLALMSVDAFPGVNLKNGNFYVSYTDIVVPGGGKKLEITRTYNSRSADDGWFGLGWGSDFETYITVSADGSVIVHENGSGASTRFTPKTAVDPKVAADKIVSILKSKNSLPDKAASELASKLVKDAELRRDYEAKLDIQTKIADGTILYSNERGMQEVHKTSDGYKRVYSDGKVELFNNNGKLTKTTEKSGYSISLNYKGKELESIKDSQAKQLFFSWYPDGKVKNIWSAGDKKVEYKFKDKDLIESKDIEDNLYKYSYDTNHNLVKIGYSDSTEMKINYDSKTQMVASINDKNGEVTKYEYGQNPKNPEFHYWTIVTAPGFDGKPVANRYEYEIKTKPDGSQYTYRILTEINNLKTETIYSECCGLPLKISRGKEVTNFEYNAKGLLLKKNSTNGEFVNIDYDDSINKITKVVNNAGWTQFTYDKQGNLAKALNSAGKAVLLVYDRNGRITKMVDNDSKTNEKRTLSFIYNALGKPVEISMDNVGKINVDYDNYGEIKKVESKAGHKMALQVTQAFQNLLSIVKPAGVNLQL
jgi:YD repeat-containing protein